VANHKSAAKRARQTTRRTLRNKVVTSETRTVVKAVRTAIANKDKEGANALLTKVQQKLDRLSKIGVIKPNAAARRTSRLVKQVNSL
jgi:small subunit ribosomal protein S20